MAETKKTTAKKTSATPKAAEVKAEKLSGNYRPICCLNLRAAPSKESDILGILQPEQVIQQRSGKAAEGWLAVSTPLGDGFCMTQYLEEVV